MAKVPTGRFVWFEYSSTDAPRAQRFFGELFGWKTRDVPTPHAPYQMILAGEDTIGGYWPTPDGAPPQAHWVSHLQVESCADSVAQVKKLGGTVKMEPMTVGEFGTFAVVADPTGAVFSLWQPGSAQTNAEYKGKPGTFIWNELHTSDPDKAVAFYEKLAGFQDEKSDMGGDTGVYHVLNFEGKGRAGVLKNEMPGVPPHWMPYVMVENVDQIVERAGKLGGKTLVPPTDIPNIGRFAVLADPLGGVTGLLRPQM